MGTASQPGTQTSRVFPGLRENLLSWERGGNITETCISLPYLLIDSSSLNGLRNIAPLSLLS